MAVVSCKAAAHKIAFSGIQLQASPKKSLRVLAIQCALAKDKPTLVSAPLALENYNRT